jgi:hypothetical protein
MRFGVLDGFRLQTPARGATFLPLLPLTTDCLKWSAECELAVAAEEHVELLVTTLSLFALNSQTDTYNIDPEAKHRERSYN